jgi:hypothetical protein
LRNKLLLLLRARNREIGEEANLKIIEWFNSELLCLPGGYCSKAIPCCAMTARHLCVCGIKSRYKSCMRTGSRTGAKPPSKRRNVITTLAALGLNGDVIAQRLGVNKNTLRAKHALELKAGREARRAEKERAAAAQLSKKERERLDCIKSSFNSHWYTKENGNDLYGGAQTIAEALEWCERFGNKWS